MVQKKEFEVAEAGRLDYPLIVLIRDVLKRWLSIIAIVIVIGIGTYLFTDYTYRPVYSSSATLVITSRDSAGNLFTNLQSTSDLASVFSELLNSSILQKKVLEELNASGLNYNILASAISETNLLTVQVTSETPRTAFLVIQSLIENYHMVTDDVIGDVAVEVLQLPKVPTSPANSAHSVRNVMLAMFASAVASCVAILVISNSRNAVRSKAEAERKLNCWCLGEIPHEKKHKNLSHLLSHRKTGLVITSPSCSFHFSETIRKLRRRVEQNIGDGKVLMVTSLMENEGKSTVAVNLALSLAKKHRKVLLIDMDLRKPACYKILNHKNSRYGTQDVISGKVSLSQAVIYDRLSTLSVLYQRAPKRMTPGRVTALISSNDVAAMMDEARSQYDYIVLDLPPMSAASDSEHMTEHADAALLVVQQNLALASELNRAITLLQNGRAKLLGCVLNNVYSMTIPDSGGSRYGYGYGYGKYGSYASGKSRD